MIRYLMIIALLFSFVGCSWNVQDIKNHAKDRLAEFNYDIVAYEGYQWSIPDGGQVWYQVKKHGDSLDIRYALYLTKWNGEYHLYGPRLIDENKIIEKCK